MNNSSIIQLVISLACFYMQSRLLVCCAGYFEATLQSAAETFFWVEFSLKEDLFQLKSGV